MTSRERVAAALRREQPDRVPFCELGVDRQVAEQILGRALPPVPNLETNPRSLADEIELAERLGKDNIAYTLRAPVFTEQGCTDGQTTYYTDGLIRSEADLDLLALPDPEDDRLYEPVAEWAAGKRDFSLWVVTRLGLFSAILSVGMERFFVGLIERPGFIASVVDRYCDWAAAVVERVCALDIDVLASTDDLAGKHGPFFSPALFRDLVTPRFAAIAGDRVTHGITRPWVLHSDGDLTLLLGDLLGLGIDGLHPNEKGAMDIRAMKRDYGERLCLLGNVDLNLLGLGTPEQVTEEVRGLIHDVGPGGGYIVTSGNSIAHYCRVENVYAMAEAVRRFGVYPLRSD